MLYWVAIHLIKHRASVNTPGFDDPKTCSLPNCRICNIDKKVRDSIYKYIKPHARRMPLH